MPAWFTMKRRATTTLLRQIDKELLDGSDRAVGILAGAFVEDHLTDAISATMAQDENTLKELFSPGRPIGDFGTKIDTGYLMYLYSPFARKELHTIRSIRNDFAHKLAINSFDHQAIRDRCSNLKSWEEIHILLYQLEPGKLELRIGPKLLERGEYANAINFVWTTYPITSRERYIAACKFYIAAFTLQARSAAQQPPPPGFVF